LVVAVRVTASEEETQAIARELSATLRAGDVVLLSGDLGAGKTTFVRGLAEGLGIDPRDVSSPTFTLVHEYRGKGLTLYHADLYRLQRAATDDLGLEEIGVKDGVLAIEWPDRLTHELAGATLVRLDVVDDASRRIIIGPAEAGPYDRT
jgi:tRNA threonylcarbamoyladenosine biosynthesis protein TsaE